MLISLSKSEYSSAVYITLVLALSSIVLGLLALRLSLRDKGYSARSPKKIFYFLFFGVVGLLLWAGWFAGPLLAFGTVLLPWKSKETS